MEGEGAGEDALPLAECSEVSVAVQRVVDGPPHPHVREALRLEAHRERGLAGGYVWSDDRVRVGLRDRVTIGRAQGVHPVAVAQHVEVARAEVRDRRRLVRHHQRVDAVQVDVVGVVVVRVPVVLGRLRRLVARHDERAGAGAPVLEIAFLRDGVGRLDLGRLRSQVEEEPGVRVLQIEHDGGVVGRRRQAVQHVVARPVHCLRQEIPLEAEEHVLGLKWPAVHRRHVRPLHALTEIERPRHPVRRVLPRLREVRRDRRVVDAARSPQQFHQVAVDQRDAVVRLVGNRKRRIEVRRLPGGVELQPPAPLDAGGRRRGRRRGCRADRLPRRRGGRRRGGRGCRSRRIIVVIAVAAPDQCGSREAQAGDGGPAEQLASGNRSRPR